MSSTNCFLPNNGFCLNLRVRIVKSPIVNTRPNGQDLYSDAASAIRLEPKWLRLDDVQHKLL